MKAVYIVGGVVLFGLLLAWMISDSPNKTGTKSDGKEGEPVTTASGLKYTDVKLGDGKEARKGNVVTVHYTGRLKNGTQFDSSVGKKPFTFPLGERKVIQGWDEGVAGMREGGKRDLIIPSELGYGASGAGADIPPHAELHFEVELLKVN